MAHGIIMKEIVGYLVMSTKVLVTIYIGSCNVNRLLGVDLAHICFVRKQGIRCLLSLHT